MSPRREVGVEELEHEVLRRIAEEQGRPVGLMISKNLPMLPTETAWTIVDFVSNQRSSLFMDDEGEVNRARMTAFTEGILCGLRISAAISDLQQRRDG